MVEPPQRQLRVFLCHASTDKESVRVLYKRLAADGVDAWLDQEKLIPGQTWREEIPKAVRNSDIFLVCLTNRSINKEGYIQREIREALDVAEEKPEGTIFIIPARLEDCVVPDRLNLYQWVDLFDDDGYEKLLRALTLKAGTFGLKPPLSPARAPVTLSVPASKEAEADRLFSEATRLNLLGDAERALQLYRRVKEMDPYHPDIDLRIRTLEEESRKGVIDRDGRVSFQSMSQAQPRPQRSSRSLAPLGLAVLCACVAVATFSTSLLVPMMLRPTASLTPPPPTFQNSVPSLTAVPTITRSPQATSTAALTYGPWKGQVGRLELSVDRVEIISQVQDKKILRFYLSVNNQSNNAINLPLYGNFLAIDSNGQSYQADNQTSNWPKSIPAATVITGSIDLVDPVPNTISVMSINFSTIFGAVEFVGKSITVPNIEVP
jgi:hypothetical protein